MSETKTSIESINTALGAENLVEKILGSSSAYFEEKTIKWSKGNLAQLSEIFKYAAHKLGSAIEVKFSVPTKVVDQILEHSPLSENSLQLDYYAGILVSSRNENTSSTGVFLPPVVQMLSAYQLRTHYLLYHLLKSHFNGKTIDMEDSNNWEKLEIYLPYATFYYAMDFTEFESVNWENIMSHVMYGLNKEDLVTNFFNGEKEKLKNRFKDVTEDGIIFQPTKYGLELFMWAYGYGDRNINDFFLKELTFSNEHNLEIGESFTTKTKD